MNIKHLSTVLLLSMTLLLAACIGEVSNDEETIYGTFSTSKLERDTADSLIRKVVEFDENSLSKAQFVDGYSVLNSSAGSSLYLGIYKYEKPVAGPSQKDWARTLQESNKSGWAFITGKSDDFGNEAEYGNYNETQYDTSDAFSVNGQKNSTAAVLVENINGTYWVYLAMPKEMIKATDDEQIVELFNKHRYSK